jgi:hypothetical protein
LQLHQFPCIDIHMQNCPLKILYKIVTNPIYRIPLQIRYKKWDPRDLPRNFLRMYWESLR